MRRYCLVMFALSSCAWAGKLAVTIVPIIPPQCAVFVTNVQVDAVTMNDNTLKFAKLTRVDLAPLQLSQILLGVKALGNRTIKTFQVTLSQAMCVARNGRIYPIYSPQSVQARGHFGAPSSSATVVLLLNLSPLRQNTVKPSVKQLKIAGHLDGGPRRGGLNGLVIGTDRRSITIINQ